MSRPLPDYTPHLTYGAWWGFICPTCHNHIERGGWTQPDAIREFHTHMAAHQDEAVAS